MLVHPDAAWRLWPTNWHAVALPQYEYAWLAEQCTCKSRQHLRKDCDLDRFRGCKTCGAMYEYAGEYPELCPGCLDWHESRIQYMGEWALAHDDRKGRQTTESQLSLFASAGYDWTDAPQPRWPFMWSRPKPTFLGEHGDCRVCGNPDDAPTSFMARTADYELHVREPVCTPCLRLGNTVKIFWEGPVESIEQLVEIIEGRNQYGFDVSELREDWVPINSAVRDRKHQPEEALAK